MAITVQRSGVWYRWTQDLPPILNDQLRLTNGLWNDLVRSHHQHEADKAEIWSSYPEVAEAEVEIAAAETQVETLGQAVRKAKIERRVKALNRTDPLAVALTAEKARLKAARARRREAINSVNEDAQARLKDALNARHAREKALYGVFVRAGGFWATYNDVARRRFGVALKRVAAQRAEGRAAELRTRHADGTGTVTVQLQKDPDYVVVEQDDGTKVHVPRDPAVIQHRTPEVLANATDSKWRNVLCVPLIDRDAWDGMTRAERKRAGRQVVRMRAGQDATGAPVYLEVPVQIHRQLPPEADVSEARLTVRRVGPDLRAALTVVATVPDPEPRPAGPMVAVHLGWSDHPNGIQIASWSSTAPLDIPFVWRNVMRTDGRDAVRGVVVIPQRVDERLEAIDKARGRRDDRLNEVKTTVAEWIERNGPLPSPFLNDDGSRADPLTPAYVRSWRSYGRFVALHGFLSATAGDEWIGDPVLLDALREWAVDDRERWRRQEHGRANVLAHRDDVLKNIAAIIARQAGVLVVDNMSIAELARKQEPTGNEVIPEEALKGVARRRVIGAPGRFREYAVAACRREGVEIVTVPAKNLSLEHTCGHVNTSATLDRERQRVCGGCGRRYRPDDSSLVLMRRRAEVLLAEKSSPVNVTYV